MENIEFLKILYGKVPEGYVGVSYIIDGKIKTKWFAVSELEDMAVFIDEMGKEYNTYYGVNPRREKLPYYVRASDKDIGYVIGVQMDFDVKGEAHKQEALPETKEELLSYYNRKFRDLREQRISGNLSNICQISFRQCMIMRRYGI